jgi:transposase
MSYSVGALPIVNRALERMRLAEFLEAYLPACNPRSKVSIQAGLLILVRNYLLSREPIYGVGEWAQGFAPDLLGLEPAQVESLNDDRVGRCLERLFEADSTSMVLALVAHVVKEYGVELDQLHNDSTTISFAGRYDQTFAEAAKRGKPVLGILFGHSKDHRPDLKQLLFILTIARDGGIPVFFSAADGNVTDDQTHRRTWDLLCRLTHRRDFLYVADSKLATAENMAHVHQHGGRFITVLPRSRSEDRAFRELVKADRVEWRELWKKVDEQGEVTDVFEVSTHPATTAEGYRLLWFRSSRKRETDALARSGKLTQTLEELAELRKRLGSPRSRFREQVKVEQALEAIVQKHGTAAWVRTEIHEQEQESFQQERQGRPGKNTRYVRKVKTRFDLGYEVDAEALAREALVDGIFPLITNVDAMSELEVLQAYKKQPLVEKRFSQLKTDFEVAPVYLKSVARIEALLCVYFLALMVQALIERDVRRGMAEAGIELLPLYPEARDCRRPCARRILDLFENIQRHELSEEGEPTGVLLTELSPIQRKVLRLAGIPSQGYGA